MADPKKIYIRPLEVTTAGGATMRARLRYSRSGVQWELPEAGAWVPRFGREGSFWRRRMAEGACEKAQPPTKSKSKKGSE